MGKDHKFGGLRNERKVCLQPGPYPVCQSVPGLGKLIIIIRIRLHNKVVKDYAMKLSDIERIAARTEIRFKFRRGDFIVGGVRIMVVIADDVISGISV